MRVAPSAYTSQDGSTLPPSCSKGMSDEGSHQRRVVGDAVGQVARRTEVDQHGGPIGADDEVGGLHVPVNHRRLERVQVAQGLQDLAAERERLRLREARAAQPRRERCARDQLLDEVEAGVNALTLAKRLSIARDARVVNPLEEATFALEGVERLRRWHGGEGELLQHDGLVAGGLGQVGPRVVGLAEELEHPISARGAGRPAMVAPRGGARMLAATAPLACTALQGEHAAGHDVDRLATDLFCRVGSDVDSRLRPFHPQC